MLQITRVKSREVTVVALVLVLHRRSCCGAAWLRGSAGLQKYLLDSPHAHSVPALHLALPGPSCICSCTAAWLVPTLPAVHSEKLQRLLKEEKGRTTWPQRNSSYGNGGSYWTLTVSLSPSEPLLDSPCMEEYTQLWSSWFCWECINQQGAEENANRRKIRRGTKVNLFCKFILFQF